MKQPDITSAVALAVLKTLSAQKTMDMTPADISRRDLRLQAIDRLEFDQETLALAISILREVRVADLSEMPNYAAVLFMRIDIVLSRTQQPV